MMNEQLEETAKPIKGKIMNEKIYLGKVKHGEKIWLTKHSWDCDWYWGFGYIGNQNWHFHINSLIDHPKEYHNKWTDITTHFSETWLTQGQWWVLRDLFISAYGLKKATEIYRYGGHQTSSSIPYLVISPEKAKIINDDLKIILDNIWDLLTKWKKEVELLV